MTLDALTWQSSTVFWFKLLILLTSCKYMEQFKAFLSRITYLPWFLAINSSWWVEKNTKINIPYVSQFCRICRITVGREWSHMCRLLVSRGFQNGIPLKYILHTLWDGPLLDLFLFFPELNMISNFTKQRHHFRKRLKVSLNLANVHTFSWYKTSFCSRQYRAVCIFRNSKCLCPHHPHPHAYQMVGMAVGAKNSSMAAVPRKGLLVQTKLPGSLPSLPRTLCML